MLRSTAASPEAVDFPDVAPVALRRRHRQPETVALVTSLPPAELAATAWRAANRAAWGIENGLPRRLD